MCLKFKQKCFIKTSSHPLNQGWRLSIKEGSQASYNYCRENFLSGRVLQVSQGLWPGTGTGRIPVAETSHWGRLFLLGVAAVTALCLLQEIASLKRQFAELLSDIGFVKEGLRARDIEKKWSQGGDGVLDATGEEVIYSISSVLQNAAAVFHVAILQKGGGQRCPEIT